MIKIDKSFLEDRNWKAIYEAVGRDSAMVAKFLKMGQKKKKIQSNDLDSILLEFAKHTDDHVVVTPSGVTFK